MDDRELGHESVPGKRRLIGQTVCLCHLCQPEILADFPAQAVQPVFRALQREAGAVPGGFYLHERLLHRPLFAFRLLLFLRQKSQVRLPGTQHAFESGQLAVISTFIA